MSFSKKDKAYLRQLNNTKLPARLFQDAVQAIGELGMDARVPECRIPALNAFFSGKGYSRQEAFKLTRAVEARMEALMQLKDQHGLLSWGVPDTRTSDDMSDPYLAAAAAEPLIQHGFNEVVFDPERFRARLSGVQPG